MIGEEDNSTNAQLAALPMRLTEFRLAPGGNTFAYAGDEVELSVWDAERAFDATEVPTNEADGQSQSKKRKRSEQLLPHEVWRAKNVRVSIMNILMPHLILINRV